MTTLISILFVIATAQLASGATMDLALQSSSFRCSSGKKTEIERIDDPEDDGFFGIYSYFSL